MSYAQPQYAPQYTQQHYYAPQVSHSNKDVKIAVVVVAIIFAIIVMAYLWDKCHLNAFIPGPLKMFKKKNCAAGKTSGSFMKTIKSYLP